MNALLRCSWVPLSLLPSADCFAQRWAWPWRDPNHLAAVAAMLLTAVTVVLLWLLQSQPTSTPKRNARIFTVALVLLGALLLILCVAASASRAGLLALVVGLGLVAWAQCGWRWRWVPLTILTMTLLTVALLPKSAARVAKLATPMADRSQTIRFDLWQAALVAVHDRPAGLGAGGFEAWQRSWFQDPTNPHIYPHALSEPLTLAAERGVMVAALLLGALVSLIGAALWLGRGRADALALAAGAMLAVALVAAAGNELHQQGAVWLLVLLAAMVAGAQLLRAGWARPRRALWLALLMPLTASVVVGIAFTAGGVWAAARTEFVPAETGLAARPRHAPVVGTVLLAAAVNDRDAELARLVLRPLAESGFAVELVRTPAALAAAMAKATAPMAVIAMADGVRTVLATPTAAALPLITLDVAADAGVALLPRAGAWLCVHGAADPLGPGATAPTWWPDTPTPRQIWIAQAGGRAWPWRMPALLPTLRPWLLMQLSAEPRNSP